LRQIYAVFSRIICFGKTITLTSTDTRQKALKKTVPLLQFENIDSHLMLQIAVSKEKKPVTRGNYRISFIIQQNTITKANVSALQLLDCLRFFKGGTSLSKEKLLKHHKQIIY
jgi:hypothetical protein